MTIKYSRKDSRKRKWRLWMLSLVLLCAPHIFIDYCWAATEQPIRFVAVDQANWRIFQIMSNAGSLQVLPVMEADPVNISISANYKKLLLTTHERKLLILDLQSGKTTHIQSKMHGMVDAVFSKDNKVVLFSLSTGGSTDANHIWKMDIESKKLTQLTHMENMQNTPIWSRDDKYIFFLSGSGKFEDIWRLDVETGGLHQLTAGNRYNFEPACSVDNEIAFSSNRSGNYEIWVMDPFGGNVRQLTHNPAMDSQPSWSPDGQQLVFVSTRDGESALYVMDREGNNTRRLTPKGLICRNPVWSR